MRGAPGRLHNTRSDQRGSALASHGGRAGPRSPSEHQADSVTGWPGQDGCRVAPGSSRTGGAREGWRARLPPALGLQEGGRRGRARRGGCRVAAAAAVAYARPSQSRGCPPAVLRLRAKRTGVIHSASRPGGCHVARREWAKGRRCVRAGAIHCQTDLERCIRSSQRRIWTQLTCLVIRFRSKSDELNHTAHPIREEATWNATIATPN